MDSSSSSCPVCELMLLVASANSSDIVGKAPVDRGWIG